MVWMYYLRQESSNMKVNKLHLQDYGQFHDKDITLAPGINVLYGANEAGKSTTKDFIIDMLYGLEDKDAFGQPNDHYEKKKPIGKDAYCGSMELSQNEKTYLVERNFNKNEKSLDVKDLDTGVEVALKNPGQLVGTLFDTDRTTYLNTLCISHLGVATDHSIVEKLNDYIVNMASTKSGDLDVVDAILQLKNKKAEFSNEEYEKRAEELSEQLVLDRDYDAEIAALKEEYKQIESGEKPATIQFTPILKSSDEEEAQEDEQEAEERIDAQSEEENDFAEGEEEEKPVLTKKEKDILMLSKMGAKSILDNTFVILFIGLVLVAIFVGVAYAVPVNVPEVKMIIIGAGAFWVLISLIQIFARRSKLHKLLEELEIEQGFEEAKNGLLSGDKEAVNAKLNELREKEQSLMEERTQQEAMLQELTELKDKIQKNEVELAALDLAIRTIQDLSEEIYASFGSILNDKVSLLIKKITRGKYTEVKIDDQLHIMVKNGNTYISMDYLSTGTIEQIYLALRLTIADLLVKDDMPIVMDDTFVTYDYQRMNDTLRCFGEYTNRQIVIFTGNPGIQDMFAKLGITSNYISI